jgi:XRE family transcriptional regulator, regulator of sulfur utilization
MDRPRQRADADARLREFGAWLRLLRQSRRLSQEQLGDRAGIDRAVIGRIERGEVNVGIAYLWQLADALDVRVQDLLPDADHPLLPRD